MPHDLRFRPEALADLEDITRAVRRVSGSADLARRHAARIVDRCRGITVLPHAGRPRDDLAPGLRTVPFERRTVIVHRIVEPEIVEITNIFSARRDYAVLYRQDDEA